MTRRNYPASTWSEIRVAYASGIGLRELARNAGIPPGTILSRAKREGWTRQVQSAKALACPPAAPLARTTSDAVATTMAERGQRHLQRVAGIVERTLPAVEAMAPSEVLDRVEDFDRLDRIGRRTFGLDETGSGVARISIYGSQVAIVERTQSSERGSSES